MKMGRERAVTRWEIHRALLTERITQTESALSALAKSHDASAPQQIERKRQLERELATLRSQLVALGPSPSAKMG